MTDHIHVNGPEHGPRASASAEALAEWRKAVAAEIAAFEVTNDSPPNDGLERVHKAALAEVRRLAHEAWAKPIAGPEDLRLRAEIVQYGLWADYHGDGTPRFEAVLAGIEPKDALVFGEFDERAVAELVKAVLWTAEPARPHARRTNDDIPATLSEELEEMLCQARRGVTTLRAVLESWERQHGMPPKVPFHECDCTLLPSVGFCADGIEGLLDRISARISEAVECAGRNTVGAKAEPQG
jgi:hypothetical protein